MVEMLEVSGLEQSGSDVDHSTSKSIPCLKAPLTKDVDGASYSESCAYASIFCICYNCQGVIVLVSPTM